MKKKKVCAASPSSAFRANYPLEGAPPDVEIEKSGRLLPDANLEIHLCWDAASDGP